MLVLSAWCIRLVPVMLFFICYYFSKFYLQNFISCRLHCSKTPSFTKYQCNKIIAQKKWESLNLNINRNARLFLKLKDFFWKKHLSLLPLPYGLKGSESVLLKILANYRVANYSMPTSIESLDCRTCVVIGNGFALKNSSLGTAINRHDIVIRMNDAPVRGYEQDVGNKTTMRLFYPESASFNPDLQNDPDTLQVLVPFKQLDLDWLRQILFNEKRMTTGFWKPPPQVWLGRISQLRILHPCFLHLTASKLLQIPLEPKNQQNPVHPSTGILAIFLALNYCDVVSVAGFGYPASQNQKHLIHYYGNQAMKSMSIKDSHHDLSREAQILKRLEDMEAIRNLHQHS
ncbi:CMP-N-acetylneuraminate-beta-galactosamide-alpha-2,3-sialyltransferase 4 isoform X2 [Electrophorus electricus]|uniref:CMP-N-acetylneuraminate-beta-galactosamide-alpha-2,3-sialyltransferase 4 n=1 Tax=Electrophorus electricus TaxID=8005 RepID=A0A4W4H536_ELEEL|nr:CMP-N-acetylneuraminate-beta-galactosamide-alpha-2,3-sialyltransferase 4 isoform X2 [Electrophorus electricus]